MQIYRKIILLKYGRMAFKDTGPLHGWQFGSYRF